MAHYKIWYKQVISYTTCQQKFDVKEGIILPRVHFSLPNSAKFCVGNDDVCELSSIREHNSGQKLKQVYQPFIKS